MPLSILHYFYCYCVTDKRKAVPIKVKALVLIEPEACFPRFFPSILWLNKSPLYQLLKCLKIKFPLAASGSLPEVTVTHLRAAAYAHDTVLALEDAVDWHPGDEVVIVSGIGVEGTKLVEETVIVETVNNADLHLRSPLR